VLFDPAILSGEKLGAKTVIVNISDILALLGEMDHKVLFFLRSDSSLKFEGISSSQESSASEKGFHSVVEDLSKV